MPRRISRSPTARACDTHCLQSEPTIFETKSDLSRQTRPSYESALKSAYNSKCCTRDGLRDFLRRSTMSYRQATASLSVGSSAPGEKKMRDCDLAELARVKTVNFPKAN
jgi:hypothetical protein